MSAPNLVRTSQFFLLIETEAGACAARLVQASVGIELRKHWVHVGSFEKTDQRGKPASTCIFSCNLFLSERYSCQMESFVEDTLLLIEMSRLYTFSQPVYNLVALEDKFNIWWTPVIFTSISKIVKYGCCLFPAVVRTI